MTESTEMLLLNPDETINVENFESSFLELAKGDFLNVLTHKQDLLTKVDADLSNFKNLPPSEAKLIGISCVLAFTQANFTGPDLNLGFSFEGLSTNEVFSALNVDGEELNVNAKHVELLFLAKNIWKKLLEANSEDITCLVWMLRTTILHQKVIDDSCISLYEEFKSISTQILSNLEKFSLKDRLLVQAEIVQGYLMYKRVYEAEKFLKDLKASSNLEFEVKGELGVRTKFQQKALPQLVLKVEKGNENELNKAEMTHPNEHLPKLLTLDDDLRLEKIKFEAEDANQTQILESVVQNVLFTQMKYLYLCQPKDNLCKEEIQPYLTTLLYQSHGPWMTRINTLMSNIRLESDHRRTVERSLRQCEEVLNLINATETPIAYRLSYCFSAHMLPRWEIEAELGELMVSLGMIKTALDLYLRIQNWEDVILCYTMLELRHKAAEVIKQEIDKKPTVKLYCLLGDATDDVSCYETAWNFSQQKSGRAQRHWGNFYYRKKEYENALPYLQKTLEINSLQEVQWLRLGYAALQLEKWEIAANAYRRYTYLEPHGFESWNNLAKAYIKMGDKTRAHKILQESLKCNFNNWKVWENFLLVSVDVGSFEDAINAYNRLVELKEKYHDKEILEIIVGAIEQDIPDATGSTAGRLKKKCLTLLGQQSAQNPTLGIVHELSSRITDDALQKAEKLQKAHRSYTQTSTNWVKDEKSCEKILDLCLKLCDASLLATKDEANTSEAKKMSVLSQLSSARLAAMGCIKVAKAENYESLREKIESLEASVAEIVEVTKRLK
ncbi:tetratricopeptide repeat protein 27 [Culicoides brevitarsis]|uniref:tetratricopeptide repeat protein 27 n=1 Tax=Culicoides brevitarsis TaxID=469753 RepID=UPI00307C06A1